MANSGSGSSEIFEVRRIRRLVEMMNEHDLSEIDLQQGEQRIRLRRGHDPIVTGAAMPQGYPPQGDVAGTGEATPQTPPPVVDESHIALIKSPMVGTFYTAPNPDSPPFVHVGDSVGPDTTVCIVEAMKVFNEIAAETSGKVIAVLVQNGDAVDFEQPMFKVDTRG